MEFGIFSNGIRPHTSASQTYDEDIREIVLADRLGFTVAYISEHHGEPTYIDRVDTIPVPELMMCKAAALTRQIRFGAAVKLIHLHHPLDVAIQAAVCDHIIGDGRFIFGFGSGFPLPLFCQERGLSYDDRHDRLSESLDFIFKCWASTEPFDWDGRYWKGTGVVALPNPLAGPNMPIVTATESEPTIRIAGARGYTLLSAFLEPSSMLRRKGELYAEAAREAGRGSPLKGIAASRIVYVADSRSQAIEDLRDAVAFETGIQAQRGFHQMLKSVFGLDIDTGRNAIDSWAEAGIYILGDADSVAAELKDFYDASGGFGTLFIVTGKDWADRERRERSMRRFMDHVVPQLRDLNPSA